MKGEELLNFIIKYTGCDWHLVKIILDLIDREKEYTEQELIDLINSNK